MTDEQINLLEHVYDDNAIVEVPGNLVYALMQVLQQVKEHETQTVFSHSYSFSAKEIKNKENKDFVEEVKLEQKDYPTAQAFFSQKPVTATSILGMAAMDLLMLLQQAHLEEIKKGNAVKVGTIKTPKKDEAIKLT